MSLGNPLYNYDDKVTFTCDDNTVIGIIAIIDAYGIFEDESQVYYDIYSEVSNILYKHIPESVITKYE